MKVLRCGDGPLRWCCSGARVAVMQNDKRARWCGEEARVLLQVVFGGFAAVAAELVASTGGKRSSSGWLQRRAEVHCDRQAKVARAAGVGRGLLQETDEGAAVVRAKTVARWELAGRRC